MRGVRLNKHRPSAGPPRSAHIGACYLAAVGADKVGHSFDVAADRFVVASDGPDDHPFSELERTGLPPCPCIRGGAAAAGSASLIDGRRGRGCRQPHAGDAVPVAGPPLHHRRDQSACCDPATKGRRYSQAAPGNRVRQRCRGSLTRNDAPAHTCPSDRLPRLKLTSKSRIRQRPARRVVKIIAAGELCDASWLDGASGVQFAQQNGDLSPS